MNIQELASQFEEQMREVRSEDDLIKLKSNFLGKKGLLALFLRSLGELSPEERPKAGAEANQLKQKIEDQCRDRLQDLLKNKTAQILKSNAVDTTLSGKFADKGSLHPITQVMTEVENIFREIGFAIFEGPQIESDYFNFEALNIPAEHPARDMQDTFYLGEDPALPPSPPSDGKVEINSTLLLRTHTSPVQIHVMKKHKPPIRMIAPGPVYRKDSDVSHTPMFHQIEGLVVDETANFSSLKGIVSYFLHKLFGDFLKVRFRASYFPFTEPSAEVDIQCVICRGDLDKKSSCRLCKTTGWLEVMGCGMVHPALFENVGYPKETRGFAFGMGIERLTMLKFGIPDIRLFFENDLRFLKQF